MKGELLVYQSFIPEVKYTMPLTNINSDWMSNASSGLCIIYTIQDLKNIKNVKGCRDGMPKSMQTR